MNKDKRQERKYLLMGLAFSIAMFVGVAGAFTFTTRQDAEQFVATRDRSYTITDMEAISVTEECDGYLQNCKLSICWQADWEIGSGNGTTEERTTGQCDIFPTNVKQNELRDSMEETAHLNIQEWMENQPINIIHDQHPLKKAYEPVSAIGSI